MIQVRRSPDGRVALLLRLGQPPWKQDTVTPRWIEVSAPQHQLTVTVLTENDVAEWEEL